MNNNYKLCYVAYIDILGFTNKVIESVNNVQTLNEIINLQNYLTDIKCKKGISDKKTYFVSDSFFFVFPFENNEISSVIWEIADMQAHIIDMGHLIRGAVTIGKTVYNEKFLFGPSVNEVVALEKKIEYPRVVLSNRLLEEYLINIKNTSFVFNDINDEISDLLDYLSYDKEYKWITHINKQDLTVDREDIKNKLLIMIEKEKNNIDERVKKKYIWLEECIKKGEENYE